MNVIYIKFGKYREAILVLKQRFRIVLSVFFSLQFAFSTSVFANTTVDSVSSKFQSMVTHEDIEGEVSFERDENGEIVKKIIKVSNTSGVCEKIWTYYPFAKCRNFSY